MVEPGDRELLSAADASNILIDAKDQVNVFLLVGILGSGFDLDDVRTDIDARINDPTSTGLGRFSQRVRRAGKVLVWESCTPDLGWHVRQVEPVDGRTGLTELAAELMTVPLPLDRPLWELLVVPGASSGGHGIILRLHHCVADGVAGVRLVQRLFGDLTQPTSQPRPAAPTRTPIVRRGWRSRVTSVTRVTAMVRATVPRTVLLGPIGPRRSLAFAEVDLAGLSRGAKSAGATVNDALLAAVCVAVTTVLRTAGQPVPSVLPASVPVALPDRGSSGNAVGIMVVHLPTGEPDAVVRLGLISAATRTAKAEARTQGTYELTRTRWGSRLFARLARHQRFVALFVTNVRGPDQPLVMGGAALQDVWPVVPIQGNVRFGVAAMSYAGQLRVTVHTDASAVDARIAGRALAAELARVAGADPAAS